MNEWGPGVNLPYYVKVGLVGTSIVLVVILVYRGYIPRKLTSESSGLFCQSRVTAVYSSPIRCAHSGSSKQRLLVTCFAHSNYTRRFSSV